MVAEHGQHCACPLATRWQCGHGRRKLGTPDLATLSAVGAAPRSRRGVAASYALVVGFVGAVLGALVGFIPGVAITYPLTSNSSYFASETGVVGTPGTGPFLDIPWLLILGLVVALPLLTAMIVGLTARSRLPLAARLT